MITIFGTKMIKNWDYTDEYESHREEILKIVDSVFSSGRLILGSRVEQFENAFSSYCSVDYGVGVNSGTDALFLALKTLGIGSGDEVITVSNTAVPTVAAIRATGAVPVFVDVEEDAFLMDINKIESAITPRTRCIMPVHLFGQPVDMAPLVDIAKRHYLKVVEDCAQAAGALYKGRKVGSFGEIGAFSFYPTKILGAYGDGGMTVTNERGLYEKLKRLRFYGMEKDYYSEEEGYNSRLDEVQAAILNFKLKTLDESVLKRRKIAEIYSKELSSVGDIELPIIKQGRTHQFHLYTIKTSYRDTIMAYLRENGIETRINYPTPIHLMRGYGFLGYKKGDLPVTERLVTRILSLPMYPGVSANDIDKVVSSIRNFFKK
ncbi:MAG: DegT/DnrJ/EryC1/StrS aminotransferase [Parcubacteria group bacterium GW2011_GWC2_38_7]|nr:MAG: DegT/DnrJ/EryC1/StrS aminotransferase [Parcubacteria group bacterium GW2011_GWC2_38_7]